MAAKILKSLIFFLFPLFATAQSKLKVEINIPATVSLKNLSDSSIVYAMVSDDSTFILKNFTQYFLVVTAAGYEEWNRKFSSGDSDTVFKVVLKPKRSSLENVTIVSRKPLVTQEDDKTIVDAAVLSESSTNAFEVLEKTPGAIVDQDGNVYLNSATPATIQINGRDVKLNAADVATLLKSLPANSVTKIEILRNPSAKYDASGSGGIINIVLKKGVKLGTNGSVNAGYTQGKYHTATAGFNLNKSSGKFQTYLSYQHTKRKNFEQLNSTRFIERDSSLLNQESYSTYPTFNNYISGGVDYQLRKNFSLAYDLRLSAGKNNNRSMNNIDIINETTGNVLDKNISSSVNQGNTIYIANSISSRYKIDTIGSEWSTDFDINFHNNKTNQDYAIDRSYRLQPLLLGVGDIDNRKNIFNVQSDLVYKFRKKYTFETGFKLNHSFSRNNSAYTLQRGNEMPVTDSFQSNRFRYKERIYSGYVQVSKTFGGLTIKPGIRMENTDINGRQLFPGDTTLAIKRTDFFPYLYLKHKIITLFGFDLTGNLIYRKSISRPFYEALNPYPRFIDQFLFDVGNPRLKPQFTTNYEFNIMAEQYPVFSVGINETKNIFTTVTYQDQVTKIAYRTFDNLGKNREMYLRAVGGIPPGKKYFFYAGAQHNINRFIGFYQGTPFEYTRGSWMFFMYHNFKASPTFTASLHGFMRLKGFQNFYELNSFGALHFSLNKSIMNKKANIILSANDILKTNVVDFSIRQAGIAAIGTRFNDTRKIGLTFRYNFGIKPKEDKQMFEAPAEQ